MKYAKPLSFGLIVSAVLLFAFFSFSFAEDKGSSIPPQKAAERGVEAIFELAGSEEDTKGEYRKSFQVIRQMESALALNIREELLRSRDPEEAYSDIEQSLSILQQNGTSFFNDISAYVLILNEQISQAEQQVRSAEESFFAAIAENDSAGSDQLFEDFIAQKKEIVRLHAERGRADAVQKKLSQNTRAIETRLAAVRNNREALIAGVQFDARTARSLGLIKEMEE